MSQGEDPTLVAVLVAVALGGRSPGDAAEALFGGSGSVNRRAVLIAACHLLWDLAEAYSREPQRPEQVLTDLAAGTLEERSSEPMTPTLWPVPATVEEIAAALRCDYRDAVRLSAREEILAELADDAVTARLHADTARFHHGSAHAYARGLKLILFFRGEEKDLDVYEDKQAARWATREHDLGPMRCQGRRYRARSEEP